VTLQAKKVVILYKKSRGIDQKAEGNELQKAFGLCGILSQGKETLIVGLFEVFPTARNVLEEVHVYLFISPVNLQPDLSVSSKQKITF